MTKIANPLIIIKKVSGGGSSVDTARIFSGATKPLTYKGTTDNVFNYTSNDYNLTLSGLDSVATISGNGTKSVSVTFNVSGTSNTTTTFTFTCTKENETLTFEGTAFYYGTELGSGHCLAVAETLSGTPLAVSYTFIESSSLPLFGSKQHYGIVFIVIKYNHLYLANGRGLVLVVISYIIVIPLINL
jgi:hypothetical protein